MPSLFLAEKASTFWLPEQASTYAAKHDPLFYFIYWLCVLFFVGLMATMTYFVIRYRRRSEDQRTHPSEGNTKLEILWSVVPGILLVVIFIWGFKDFTFYLKPPSNSVEIYVTGKQWVWDFTYPNGVTKTTGNVGQGDPLVVPEDTPVKLIMTSQDVLHSFYVPAFRVKRDVVPFKYTVLWFEATETGEYDLFCTEYCGRSHSTMIGKVKVVPQDEWEEQIKPEGWDPDEQTLAEFGEEQFNGQGCTACHSIDGTRMVGPSLQGLWAKGEEQLQGGETVQVDEEYLRESITNPQAKIVEGFGNANMPSYANRSDDVINGLVEYIKSLE
jgi:cytochrome c oxidase subunit 2